jgi:putative tryptophan/tyrosine transport system substrate-binding protein
MVMNRRDLIFGLGGAIAWPLAARAQQPEIPVIGYLNSGSAVAFAEMVQGVRDGLNEAGFAEGRNVAIEYRWAEGHYDRLPALAGELVARRVALIVAAGGAVTALAAKAATSTIPIVIVIGDDPVKFGIVESLSRPGGNITGVTLFIDVLTPKRLELLSEMVPGAALTMLANPRNPNAETEARSAQEAARQIGRELRVLDAGSDAEIDAAFASLAGPPGAALMIGTDPFFFARRAQLVALAASHAVPTIYFHRAFALAGGLASYGANFTAELRLAGAYAGRILKGQKPSELPIVQPSKFELVINLKTAKALGLTVPQALLARADEVIE